MQLGFTTDPIKRDYNDTLKFRNDVFHTQGMNHHTHFIVCVGIGGR